MVWVSETRVFVAEKMVFVIEKMVFVAEKMVFIAENMVFATEKMVSKPGTVVAAARKNGAVREEHGLNVSQNFPHSSLELIEPSNRASPIQPVFFGDPRCSHH